MSWPAQIYQTPVGGQNLYTNTVRRAPRTRAHTHTPGRLFGVYVLFFLLSLPFPWKGTFRYTPNLFFAPVEALEFSELKTTLVHAFVPSDPGSPAGHCLQNHVRLTAARRQTHQCWPYRVTTQGKHAHSRQAQPSTGMCHNGLAS